MLVTCSCLSRCDMVVDSQSMLCNNLAGTFDKQQQ
jgi:hypothetical protein